MAKYSNNQERLNFLQSANKWFLIALLVLSTVGCGHGIESSDRDEDGAPNDLDAFPDDPSVSFTIDAMGVDGPLSKAQVAVYKLSDYMNNFDPATNFRSTNGLTPVASGESNEDGLADDLIMSIGQSTKGPFLLEVQSTQGQTTDRTTNSYPVVETVRTIITEAQYAIDYPRYYATALTTLAVDYLVSQDLNVDTIDLDLAEVVKRQSVKWVLDNLERAGNDVKSLYGFGLNEAHDFDIFTTPPVFDESTVSVSHQKSAAAYRMALETFAVLVSNLIDINDPFRSSADKVMLFLQDPLCKNDETPDFDQSENNNDDKGDVCESHKGFYGKYDRTLILNEVTQIINNNAIFDRLKDIDNNVRTIESIMEGELGSISALIDSVSPSYSSPDSDLDGVHDISDVFPFDPAESVDSDEDGLGDNADLDDDNDGVFDFHLSGYVLDAFPLDPSEHLDTDGDLVGNNEDDDDDGDGVNDVDDAFPLDPNETYDSDSDGVGDVADEFPNDPQKAGDSDKDGIDVLIDYDDNNEELGARTDPDIDGDGVNFKDSYGKILDRFPLDRSEWADEDRDENNNIIGDGVGDNADRFPDNITEWADTDDDGYGDNSDVFPYDITEWADDDGDSCGNNLDELDNNPTECFDADGDGIGDNEDRFVKDPLETTDADLDLIGDNADPDDDNDGANDFDVNGDPLDLFPLDPNEINDSDGDGVGDNSDPCPFASSSPKDFSCSILERGELVFDFRLMEYFEGAEVYGLSELKFNSGLYTLTVISESIDNDSIGLVARQTATGVGSSITSKDDTSSKWRINSGERIKFTLTSTQDGSLVNFKNVKFSVPAGNSNDLLASEYLIIRTGINPFDLQGGSELDFDSGSAIASPGWVDQISSSFSLESKIIDGDSGNGFRITQVMLTTVSVDGDLDGLYDADDSLPLDTDNDGLNNNIDADDDNDGVNDVDDDLPMDPSETVDTDGDGVGNNSDHFPEDANEWVDTNNDGTGNNEDDDDDGDEVNDVLDAFPLDLNETNDTDSDGIGDNADNCLETSNVDQFDSNNDGEGDVCDGNSDSDFDGIQDDLDAFPADLDENMDTDGDGIGDNADLDDDNDGVNDVDVDGDPLDAFPLDPSETVDTDGNGIGNNTDPDDDNDGVNDVDDDLPLDPSETVDTDGDGIGNNTDPDDDDDGVNDVDDACPLDSNGRLDFDGDGICNNSDPFPTTFNDDDNDGVADNLDAFPLDPNETVDSDGDGIGNNSDNCPFDGPGASCPYQEELLNFDFIPDSNQFGQSSLVFVSNNYQLTVTTDPIGGQGLVAKQIPQGIGVKTNNINDWKVTEGEKIIFSLADSNDEPVNFSNVKFSMPASPSFGNNQRITLSINGSDYLIAGSPGGARQIDSSDAASEGLGSWEAEEAAMFSLLASAGLNGTATSFRVDSMQLALRTFDPDEDGYFGADDEYPLDSNRVGDFDSDGKDDLIDIDDDNDGIPDTQDINPLTPLDTDGDGLSNNYDDDDDNDGTLDSIDDFPLDARETTDSDGDGVGDNADDAPNDPLTQVIYSISVMGVDGPLANAPLSIYKLNDYLNDNLGSENSVASGASDNIGLADNLVMSGAAGNGPFVLLVSSIPATFDTTTNLPPVFETLKTIITAEQYGSDQIRFYATPLTTLAVNKVIYGANTNLINLNDPQILANTLNDAQDTVKALFGFGLLDDIDIFTLPPVLDDSTANNAAQVDAINYRLASETLAALVSALIDPSGLDTAEKVIDSIQADLDDNGVNDLTSIFDEVEAAVETDLTDAGSSYLKDRLGSDTILSIMNDESFDTAALLSGLLIPPYGSPDSDNDGVTNTLDLYPQDPSRYADTIPTPLAFSFNSINGYNKDFLTFTDTENGSTFTLTVTAESSINGVSGTLATQTATGIGSKAGNGNSNWKISETEKINFSLSDSSGQSVDFNNMSFTITRFPSSLGDEATISIDGSNFTSALIPGSINDSSTGVDGDWSDQEASSFSITPSSSGSEIRILSLSVTALVPAPPP